MTEEEKRAHRAHVCFQFENSDEVDDVTVNVSNNAFRANDFKDALAARKTIGCLLGDLQLFTQVDGKKEKVTQVTIPLTSVTEGKPLILRVPKPGQLNHSLVSHSLQHYPSISIKCIIYRYHLTSHSINQSIDQSILCT
jgi:hypothetical protein